MNITLNIDNLKFLSKWDENERSLLINAVSGKVLFSGKILGFNLTVEGLIEASENNCLCYKIIALSGIPFFLRPVFLPVVLRELILFLKRQFHCGNSPETLTIDKNRILIDLNRLNPAEFKILLQV